MSDETIPAVNATKTPVKQSLVEYAPDSNPVKVYCNSAQLRISPWDFQLIFGEMTGVTGQVQAHAIITMSPQHTKVLIKVLTDQMSEWEKEHGPVKIPSDVIVGAKLADSSRNPEEGLK